jgi:hypothetical protein
MRLQIFLSFGKWDYTFEKRDYIKNSYYMHPRTLSHKIYNYKKKSKYLSS